MQIVPINGNVLVQRWKKENKSSLLLAKEEYEPFYCIIGLADDLCDVPHLKTGECVYLSVRSYPQEVGENMYMISYKDIIGYVLDK